MSHTACCKRAAIRMIYQCDLTNTICSREGDALAEPYWAATCRLQAMGPNRVGLWTLGRCRKKLGRSLVLPTAYFTCQITIKDVESGGRSLQAMHSRRSLGTSSYEVTISRNARWESVAYFPPAIVASLGSGWEWSELPFEDTARLLPDDNGFDKHPKL